MPVPYRKTPRTSGSQCAAYIDVIWVASTNTFYGAVLIIDSQGQPLEFVHNSLEAPAGFLWPGDQVRRVGVAALCHSLFEGCTRDPELLVCSEDLGDVSYCRSELDPAIPFAQAVKSNDRNQATWTWINNPPSASMTAHSLAETLQTRGFAIEPFERIAKGLRELYPTARWPEAMNDPGR